MFPKHSQSWVFSALLIIKQSKSVSNTIRPSAGDEIAMRSLVLKVGNLTP